MAHVSVPKDLTHVESKMLFGLTKRQILREFVEQIRVSEPYTTGEQQKRVKIREIEMVYNFIDAFDFEGAREQSQTAQDKNNVKAGAA